LLLNPLKSRNYLPLQASCPPQNTIELY